MLLFHNEEDIMEMSNILHSSIGFISDVSPNAIDHGITVKKITSQSCK